MQSIKVDSPYGGYTLFERSGLWSVRKQSCGERITKSLKTSDVDEAKARAEIIIKNFVRDAIEQRSMSKTDDPISFGRQRRRYQLLDSAYIDIYRRARGRAKKDGFVFNLSETEMQSIVIRASGKCEITGAIFTYKTQKQWSRAPWAPSLDRIYPDLGYTLDNCRLVCVAVNWAMSDWGEGVLNRISMLVVARIMPKMAGAYLPHHFSEKDVID